MQTVPAHVVTLAAELFHRSEDEVLSRHQRFADDAATFFSSGGRGGLQVIIGDDGSVLTVPTSRGLAWGVDLFRQGIRDAESALWHAPDQARSAVEDRSGSSPDQIAAAVLGVPVQDAVRSTARLSDLAATAFAHPVRGAGAVIVGDDGGVCAIPSRLSREDSILLYRAGVRHSDAELAQLRSPRAINSAACALALYRTLSTGRLHEAEARVLTVAEVESGLGRRLELGDQESVAARLLTDGPGTHAIIGWDRAPGFSGHWLTAFYDGSAITLIDAQHGETHPWPPASEGVVRWEVVYGTAPRA